MRLEHSQGRLGCRVPWRIALGLVLACAQGAGARAAGPGGRLEIQPASIRLAGSSARQQVAVTLYSAQGTVRDVTRESRLSIVGPACAGVDPGAVVRGLRDGEAELSVRWGGLTASAPVRIERAAASRPVSFRVDVAPVLSKAGCNMGTCHGNLNGKGGFKLSLRGDSAAFDFTSLTRDAAGRRINLERPERSLILLKPTGQVAHEGGMRFGIASPEADTLRAWVSQGASDDPASAPRLRTLEVWPPERIADPGTLAQQLVVTAVLDDGRRLDVTRQAAYDVSDPTLAAVTAAGLVQVRQPCETAISVRFMNARGTARLAFPANRPDFTWSGPESTHPIDAVVFAKLQALRIHAAPLASDPVFLRRAYLDAIGRLPTPEEASAFLADTRPDRRARVIDGLLERPELADFWALKWADLLRNEEKTMSKKGAWALERWLRDQIARDVPLDEMARRIVTGLGSTYSNPPASFHRTNRDPTTTAESFSQVFLGVRLQCARCHNHPYDVWTQDDYYGLAAFFSNIARKEINNVRGDFLDSHEINSDELIFLKGPAGLRNPRTGEPMRPRGLGAPQPAPEGRELDSLAASLGGQNPQFTRNLANRVWFHLMGRGVVEPVDDFRESNPPSNPALLDLLARTLARDGMRLRPLMRFIMTSATYQLSARPDATNAGDVANFSHALVRPLAAETLLDAVSQVLGAPERFRYAPAGARAVQLPGVAQDSGFLKTFGKPDRLLSCECERSESTTLAQAFQMISGETVRRKLETRANTIGRLIDAGARDPELASRFYRATLCREPTAREREAVAAYVKTHKDRRAAWEDLVWALLNSKDFLLRQ